MPAPPPESEPAIVSARASVEYLVLSAEAYILSATFGGRFEHRPYGVGETASGRFDVGGEADGGDDSDARRACPDDRARGLSGDAADADNRDRAERGDVPHEREAGRRPGVRLRGARLVDGS